MTGTRTRDSAWETSQRESILFGSQGFQDSLQVRCSIWETEMSLKRWFHYLWAFSTQKAFIYFTLLPHRTADRLSALIFSGLSSFGCDVYPPVASRYSICPAGLWNRLYTYFNICEKTLSCRPKWWCNNRATADLRAAPPAAIFDLVWMGRLMGHSWNTARSLFRPISTLTEALPCSSRSTHLATLKWDVQLFFLMHFMSLLALTDTSISPSKHVYYLILL